MKWENTKNFNKQLHLKPHQVETCLQFNIMDQFFVMRKRCAVQCTSTVSCPTVRNYDPEFIVADSEAGVNAQCAE